MGKIPVLGEFNKNFNFSTKFKLTIYDMLFFIARYPPKNDNKYLPEIRNQDQNSHFAISEVFPDLRPI